MSDWYQQVVVNCKSFEIICEEEVAIGWGGFVCAEDISVKLNLLVFIVHQVNLDFRGWDFNSNELVPAVLHWVINRNKDVFISKKSLSNNAGVSSSVNKASVEVRTDSKLFHGNFSEDRVCDNLFNISGYKD